MAVWTRCLTEFPLNLRSPPLTLVITPSNAWVGDGVGRSKGELLMHELHRSYDRSDLCNTATPLKVLVLGACMAVIILF